MTVALFEAADTKRATRAPCPPSEVSVRLRPSRRLLGPVTLLHIQWAQHNRHDRPNQVGHGAAEVEGQPVAVCAEDGLISTIEDIELIDGPCDNPGPDPCKDPAYVEANPIKCQ